MSIDLTEWIGTAAEREVVRGVLQRELILRIMLHDLRGSLTAVRGWVELLSMDGSKLPGGLVRSVEGFSKVVRLGAVAGLSAGRGGSGER